MPSNFRTLLLVLGITTAAFCQIDARELIRKAVAADQLNWDVARNYNFMQSVELRHLDGQGRVKSSEVQIYKFSLLEGTPYRQLIERDGRPLRPAEEKRERDRLTKSVAERRKENPVERARRLSTYERRPDWIREAWQEVADAFEFRLIEEQRRDGRAMLVIEAVPLLGYQPHSRTAKVFSSVSGTFWVDRQDQQIVKIQVEVIEAISVGLFLVRVGKGSRATLELALVSDGVWLPNRLQVFASARIGLVKTLRIEEEVRYSRYSIFSELPLNEARLPADSSIPR